jgi:hypothetical protein
VFLEPVRIPDELVFVPLREYACHMNAEDLLSLDNPKFNHFRVVETVYQLAEGLSETHYSVKQIAGFWGVSEDLVRRLFENEPGVLKIGKKKYFTLRIPEEVLNRVYLRLRK